MSPALITRAPANARDERSPLFDGQISRSSSSSSSDFPLGIQSERCRAMNPPNAGNRSSGFSGPSEGKSDLKFDAAPSGPRSGSGLARPRLVKVRKGVGSSQSLRFSEIPKARVDLGFNPFRPGSENPGVSSSESGSEAFVFGATWSDGIGGFEKNVVEGLKGLKIAGSGEKDSNFDRDSTAKSGDRIDVMSELPVEMEKLNIDGFSSNDMAKLPEGLGKMSIEEPGAEKVSEQVRSGRLNSSVNESLRFGTGRTDNVGKNNIDSELVDELKAKLNVKGGDFPSGNIAVTLRDQIEDLNIKESPSVTDEKGSVGGEFIFTSKGETLRTPSFEFRTAPSKATNLFSGLNEKLEFTAKRDSVRDAGTRKKGGKSKAPTKVQLWLGQDFVHKENSSRGTPEPPDCYSPMEISPYRETLAENHRSRETSLASEDSISVDNDSRTDSAPKASNSTVDEDLAMATERMDISDEANVTCQETKEEHLDKESVSGIETESFASATEEVDFISDTIVTEAEATSSSNAEENDTERMSNFHFTTSSEDLGGSNFTFSASNASQAQNFTSKRIQKKKTALKVGHESNTASSAKVPFVSPSSSQFIPYSGASLLSSPGKGQKGDPYGILRKTREGSEPGKAPSVVNQASELSTSSANIAAQEACEKWRLRGNQAYTSGDLSKAEDCYTQGISSISRSETSRSCLRALMLCYSNRAATRISLGRIRDALGDCSMAAEIDPNFLRVQLRAANCYLSLGEVEDAALRFKRCLHAGTDVCVDRKVAVEASEGLQKVQKVSECIDLSSDLMRRKTSSDIESVLDLIAQALTISPYSEILLEMKAEALFSIRRYEEAIELCDQTVDSAERNSVPIDHDRANLESSNLSKYFYYRVWRCRVSLKSHCQLGRLEDGLTSLEKLSNTCMNENKILESLLPLAATVRELVHHKAAGNEAFQSGRHVEAVERYSAALSCNVESRPFAAVCFCNRAAAHKALGQISDAIADCSLAMALDRNYLKAVSRRATLYEMIRDYSQATRDLERLVECITKQLEEKNSDTGSSDRSSSSTNDLRQARLRLSEVEEESRKDIPLNMYLILGVDPSVSTSEIKKAYRKAALRHHPDKAGQFFARSENGDDGLWKEIAEEVYKDADRLFKMIGEAYAVLSDANKRARYDADEEMRNMQKKRNGSNVSRAQTDPQSYPFERSGSRRQWRDVWKAYGSSASSFAEATRSNRSNM